MPRSVSRIKKAAPRRKDLAQAILSPSLLESIPDAIAAVDEEGTIVQVNSQTENMFGYSHQELIGQKIEMLVPERHRTHHHTHRAHFGEKPKIRRMGAGLDLHGRRRDGSEFPVEISLSAVKSTHGMLILSAIRDISDRKKIEEELRRAHEELRRWTSQQLFDYRTRLAAIVDSSEDAIIGKDLHGVITSWNKGAEHMYGYSAEEVMGKPVTIIVPKETPDEIPQIMAKIREGEALEQYEATRVTKDGRRLTIALTVAPIRDSEGKIVGASAIGRNITEQKRAEDQLRQAQKMEAVGRLAGGIAHDFNNILGVISACSEFLRDRIEQGSKEAQFVENLRKAAERGASLTRQLLVFSRKQVVKPQVLNLNDRLVEVSKLLRPLMGDDVEIVISPKSDAAFVEADPGQLDQIVMNLAVNARHAMPNGGRLILETSTMQFDEGFARLHYPMTAGKYVLLAVSDNGMGMDEATVQRIFEPFFTTKEVGKGTGLGLATVYGIVKQAGGYIWVYSEAGRGTTFKIYMPSAEHKVESALEVEPEAMAPRHEGTTVLLVEDDEMFGALTRQMLEEHGYRVLTAKDGKSALETVQANDGSVKLVLTDVVMRGVSGPEMVKKLKKSHPGIRVVYMSGYTGELIADRDVLEAGITLLEKPFTRAALLKAIDAALGGNK
jgi:PAS domain S-box-containing protein